MMLLGVLSRYGLLLAFCWLSCGRCYQQQQNHNQQQQQQQQQIARYSSSVSRRKWLLTIPTTTVAVAATATTAAWSLLSVPSPSMAATTSLSNQQQQIDDPRVALKEAQETLVKLLENWDRATVDCTFADVPRELLEQKNKQLLLEKASTFALFDKSVSVVSCKTSNRIVRDYLGVTGKGPLVGIDKKIRQALEWMEDPDQLDNYLNETEKFAQALSRAASLSYAAGVADFDAVNNFEKDSDYRDTNSNLEQARQAIVEAKESLDQILALVNFGG